ncbi:MAG: hypothetical protein JWM11_3104, partial [Planctomycetaceae bacterium]|nr:hypothetical protein [Planctomycetaceae bacterium]
MLLNLNLTTLARRLATTWQKLAESPVLARKRVRQGSVEILETRQMLTTFTVTTRFDLTDPNDGVMSLREALTAANANSGADDIVFPADVNGVFNLTQGELEVSDPVAIHGHGTASTIVDAQNASRVFLLTSTAGNVTFDGMTIADGKTTGDGTRYAGAGIGSASHGTLSLLNSTVTGNVTTGIRTGGAGLFIYYESTLVVTNSTISFNTTTGDTSFGAGIYGFGGGSLVLTNSTISGNSTHGLNAKGGGLAWETGQVTLAGSDVTNNSTAGQSSDGGGIYSRYAAVSLTSYSTVTLCQTNGDFAQGGGIYSAAGNIIVSDSRVGDNSTDGLYAGGGGIFAKSRPVSVTGSTIYNNTASGFKSDGGGIAAYDKSLTLVNSTVSGNSAVGSSSGGGIFAYGETVDIRGCTISGNSTLSPYGGGGGISVHSSVLTLVNSTISGNSSTGNYSVADAHSGGGGGIAVTSSTFSMTNCTVVDNNSDAVSFIRVGYGGGVFLLDSNVVISNSIIAQNTNFSDPDIYSYLSTVSELFDTVSISNSLIGDNSGAPLAAAATPDAWGNLVGTADAPINPHLGPLQINGNVLVKTRALLANSPAIDRGNDSQAAGLTSDQAGQPRISGMHVDLGALELQFPTVSFASSTIPVLETAGTFPVTVNLSAPSTADITIPFSVVPFSAGGGTATSPDDFTILTDNPLVIPAGQTSATIQVHVVNRPGYELSRTVILLLGDPQYATFGTSTITTLTILDADPEPVASFSTATQAVSEDVGQVSVTVNLSAPSGLTSVFPFYISGTATNPDDFTIPVSTDQHNVFINPTDPANLVGQIILPAGQTTATFIIDITNDFIVEQDETISLTLGVKSGATGTIRNVTLGNPLTDTITIFDDDNTAPSILFNAGNPNDPLHPPKLVFTIPENLPQNAVVGTVIALDPDTVDPFGILTFSLSDNPDDAFTIDPVTGLITVLDPTPLDFETDGILSGTVTVEDGGGLSADMDLEIDLADVNDAPTIPQNQVFFLTENTPAGSLFDTVLATDPDTTAPDKTLTYSLSSNPGNVFAINPSNGILSVVNSAALDFEITRQFIVGVTVADGGTPSYSATENVTVMITNVNEPPSIAPQLFSVAENSPAGTVVGKVIATDPDQLVPFNTLTFSLSNNPGNVFSITATGPDAGQITVANPAALDFETTTQFIVGVTVADGGSPSLSLTQNVIVNVTNVNEPPTINLNQVFTIPGDSAANAPVGKALASDPEHGNLTYSILSGLPGNPFTIDASNGNITVSSPKPTLDFTTTPTFTLQVQVTDTGNLSATQAVTVNLTQPNRAPIIGGGSSTVTFTKKHPAVPLMPNLTVNDPDSPTDLARIVININVPRGGLATDVKFANSAGLGSIAQIPVPIPASSFKKQAGVIKLTMTLNAGVTSTQV